MRSRRVASLPTLRLDAFLVMAGLGLAMVVLRHLAWWSVVPLTLGMMRNISQGAFHRVQRFSTDWHNNSFAGSIVRKITRGMWALDMINDVLLLALLPSLVVLVGTVVLLGQRWPVMGVVMGAGLHRLRAADGDARDAPHRSGFAPLQCAGHAHRRCACRRARRNAVVKSFGAEAREDARLSRVINKWSRRTHRTWMRFTPGAARASSRCCGSCARPSLRRRCGCGGRGGRRRAKSPTC